jgi:branched-chain amino acid transport system permease protein
MDILGQVFINGILIGGVFALISIGLTLIFGVMRVINFAHGDLLMTAMYTTYFLSLAGVDPYISILIAIPVYYIAGILLYKIFIHPVIRSSSLTQILTTLGLAILLQNLALIFFKGDMRTTNSSLISGSTELYGFYLSNTRLMAFGVTLVATLAVFLFLKRTWTGKAIRATTMDRHAAALMGIDFNRVYTTAFAIGIALVGIAGALLAPMFQTFPTVGSQFGNLAFIVVVLGGLGDLKGAVLGGLIIGLVDAFSAYYLTTGLKEAVYFGIFILVLLIRPSGIFGLGKGWEGVGMKS